ncbi:MAG: hypothetical protein Q8P41_00280 [Pseudomonadota bacterium]|nr:hypothetical protein [Pseudomonadota bacterium]
MTLLLLLTACGGGTTVLEGAPIGSCSYTSPFSSELECREYYSADADYAESDCVELLSTFEPDASCNVEELMGTCTYSDGDVQLRTYVDADAPDRCGTNKFGCEFFAKGDWEPGPTCDGNEEIAVLEDPFPQPVRVCVDPLPDEPAGQSEGGQVCTWEVVSGATEDGRSFTDYAECDTVIRQRGFSAAEADARSLEDDPRMDDPTYVAEVDWVRTQIRAGACECCHASAKGVGAAVFDADFEGNLLTQFHDNGLAMGAGWIPTIGFGTYPPEENNGFWRSSPENPNLSVIPTTDPDRMIAIFEAELANRGLTPADFAGLTYGGAGPLDEQLAFVAEACSEEEGVADDGTIRWLPGRARYVYVMEAGSLPPTVPPNLDLPDGTIWRIDVPEDGTPVFSETVTYGQTPDGMTQQWPTSGAPEALVDGKQYYLYVAADVLFPISRCLFTAGEPAPSSCDTTGGGGVAGLAGLAALAMLRGRTGRGRRPGAS